jgi:hypothetical protein
MWEEDPRYQESKYRFLVGCMLVALGVGFILSWWSDDLSSYGYFLTFGAIGLAALAIYAGIVWMIGQSTKRIIAFIARQKNRR